MAVSKVFVVVARQVLGCSGRLLGCSGGSACGPQDIKGEIHVCISGPVCVSEKGPPF